MASFASFIDIKIDIKNKHKNFVKDSSVSVDSDGACTYGLVPSANPSILNRNHTDIIYF